MTRLANDDNALVTLRLLQTVSDFRARLSGDFSSVHGLSVNDFLLMLHLDQAPKHRLSRVDLAKKMRISASTVTRMARPMEKLGLLDRQAHVRDARSIFVVLTQAGQTKFQEASDSFMKQSQALLADRWSDEDVAQLSTLLHRLVATEPWVA